MKKILFAITITTMLSLNTMAQKDSFFSDWSDYDNIRTNEILTPELPNGHGLYNDQDAPLGSGLLILTALGAGYALSRRKNEKLN